jgi:hypothetical protein
MPTMEIFDVAPVQIRRNPAANVLTMVLFRRVMINPRLLELAYVHPRMTKSKSSSGMGTPKAHKRIQPTFPACGSFGFLNGFIS